MIRRKLPLYMQAKDLGELYTYLELFGRVYDGYDREIETIRKGIESIYTEEYPEDANDALNRLKNPREAGRKQKYGQSQVKRVQELADAGLSIRRIAAETGIPKSSVQRWLKEERRPKINYGTEGKEQR